MSTNEDNDKHLSDSDLYDDNSKEDRITETEPIPDEEDYDEEKQSQVQQLRESTPRSRSSLRLLRVFATGRGGSDGGEEEETARWNKERRKLGRELLAELIGTFLIVLFGTGAVMSAVVTNALQGLFQIAAVWIIGVTLAIATTASISGAHLNPAISFAFALLRPGPTFGWAKFIPFCVAQFMGAILASWTNLLMYASQIRDFEAANNIVRSSSDAIATAKCFGEYYLDPVSTAQAFFAEAVGTAVLAGVIFSLTHPGNDTVKHNVYIPPLIGMTVGGLICVIAPLTQAGFNPARDFGPRIVAYAAGWTQVAFHQAWLYIVAPMVGAPVGAWFVDKFLYGAEEESHTTATSHD